jgi:hypothetical protein
MALRLVGATIIIAACAALYAGSGSPTAAQECARTPSGLVSRWPGGGNANDVAGGLDGELRNGATFGAGIDGRAFRLDGVDDHVRIGNPAALRLRGGVTLSAWVNPSTLPSGGVFAIITKWGQSPSSDAYGLYLQASDGAFRPLGGIGVPGDSDDGLAGGGSFAAGTWTHVAMTYDGSSGVHRLFVNGREVAERVRPGGVTATDASVMIGREDSAEGRHFAGLIDDAQVFDRALSPQEIGSIAGARGGTSCPTPTATATAVPSPTTVPPPAYPQIWGEPLDIDGRAKAIVPWAIFGAGGGLAIGIGLAAVLGLLAVRRRDRHV